MSRYCVQAGWDHAPHLTEAAKAELLAGLQPYQKEARSKGTPSLGAGAIYGIAEEDFVVPDFAPIPNHWWQAYALDVGWNRTAAVWLAHNRDSDIVYFTSEHYAGDAIPAVHAAAIKGRGEWVPGVIDPAARGRTPVDGTRLIELYEEAGLHLTEADNSVEAGIYAVRQRLLAGKLKVFQSLVNWLAEYRQYRRDEKGRVVKKRDHLMDCGRYGIMSGLAVAKQNVQKRMPFGGVGGSRVFSG